MISEVERLPHSIPKVSVMVVTYNQAHVIRETLDSILAQDYGNLEVVVADDASTDGTQDIVAAYAERYPDKMVLVLNSHNLGITGNCNVALAACTGELICLFAGDDVMLPGKIKAQVQVFADPDVSLCYHPVEIFDSATGQTLYVTFQNPHETVRQAEDIILGGGMPGACSVMVRRSACPATGFDQRLPNVSDWLFILEVAFNGTIGRLDGIYGRYRKHREGTTQRVYEYLEESLRTLDLVVAKHPERMGLAATCQRGKARYLAGEAFRQLAGDVVVARDLALRAVALAPRNLKYLILWRLARWSRIARFFGPVLNRGKYFIKRYM